MRHLFLTASFAACGLLSACAEQPTDPLLDDGTVEPVAVEANASPAATTDPADVAVDGTADLPADSPVWFEPARIDGCQSRVTGVIHWDASRFPGVQTVKVGLPAGDGTESVFATSANVGQKETGPWLSAGSEVILRNSANDEELARVKLPGLPCED